MLVRETAQEQLETFQIKDGHAQAKARVKTLAGAARDVGLRLLGKPSEQYYSLLYTLSSKEQEKLAKNLEGLSGADRLELFNTLFPQLGPTVAHALEMQKGLPYQVGYSRKAFRAPDLPAATLEARLGWLERLLRLTLRYDPELDLNWYAAWTPYLGYGADDTLGYLFAAAIEQGNVEVFYILTTSAKGEHPIGAMGRHVPRALLIANKPEGWEFIENLLIAAQRQEGLRQVILETVDESHPEAFVRMLRLLSEGKTEPFRRSGACGGCLV